MKTESKNIMCPGCGEKIDVNQIVYNSISEELKKDYFKKLSSEKAELEKKLRISIVEETNDELVALKNELNEKVAQVKELNKTKAELERAKREKEELKDKIEVESEEKYSRMLGLEKERLMKEISEKSQLRVAEKEHVIEQLKEQLREAQRKAEQGSMQVQGEIQEIAIENYLREHFPLDEIREIKKGARGADCVQIINSRTHQNCGRVYFESKNTKQFSSA